MRAAVLQQPGRLEIIRKPAPRPGPGEVLLRVQAASLCGTDLKILSQAFFDVPLKPGMFERIQGASEVLSRRMGGALKVVPETGPSNAA